MEITQEIVTTAIAKAMASQPTRTHLSVMDVYQYIPAGTTFPRRSTIVADAIVAMFPQAEDLGGGVYELNQVVEETQEEDEAEALFGTPDASWTASNGQHIRVWSADIRGQYHVAADAKFWTGKRMEPVPAKFAAVAQKHGVVAMLGPVGLNAERKTLCQQIDRSGLKSQPVG